VSKELNDDLLFIIKKNAKEAKIKFSDESFPQLFGEQKMKAAIVKDARAMRWHPLFIKWCLHFQHKSNGAYELLQTSGWSA